MSGRMDVGEQSEDLRSEVERLEAVADASASLAESLAGRLREAWDRATAAEAELDGLRAKIHEVGPAGDRVRAMLGLRWGPEHSYEGGPVRRPVGDRVPAEPLAICANCGRGMNPGDEMCCPGGRQ